MRQNTDPVSLSTPRSESHTFALQKWASYKGRIIQGSYKFLDPKFKTFSRLFSKTIISFSNLKVIKSSDQYIPAFSKNPKKQSLHDALQTYGRDWIRFDKNEENFTHNESTCCSFEKKNFRNSRFCTNPEFKSSASLRPTEQWVIERFNCTSRFTRSKFYLKNVHSFSHWKGPNPSVICDELSELYSFGFWIPRCGFRITCQWNLDSGFLELNSWFHNPGFRNSTSRKKFPECGLPYVGRNNLILGK